MIAGHQKNSNKTSREYDTHVHAEKARLADERRLTGRQASKQNKWTERQKDRSDTRENAKIIRWYTKVGAEIERDAMSTASVTLLAANAMMGDSCLISAARI